VIFHGAIKSINPSGQRVDVLVSRDSIHPGEAVPGPLK